jgi:hypothetical protein
MIEKVDMVELVDQLVEADFAILDHLRSVNRISGR